MTLAILRAANALNRCDEFGPLHIVVADGNINDDCLDFCASPKALNVGRYALRDAEIDCLQKLRALNEDERERAWTLAGRLLRFSPQYLLRS